MFRNSLRRCAASARAATTATILSQARTLPIAVRRTAFTPSSVAPLNRIASIARAYSSETTAAQDVAHEEAELPAEPLEEILRFAQLEGVHPNLRHTLTNTMGYNQMTPVQAKTIGPALKGTDIVAQAKTGTGKTVAFLLPMVQRMLNEDPSLASLSSRYHASANDIRGIVLSPTRELAEQIAMEARRLTKKTGLVVQCAVGGTERRSMLQRTRREGCHLLVATPGRLNDLLSDPMSGIEAPNLAALVLDEADRMLDVGFERELNEIISYLPDPAEKERQTLLVSATIPDSVIKLARSMVRAHDFEFIQTIPENESLTHENVPQHLVPVSSWGNVFPSLFELIDRERLKAEEPGVRPFKAIVYFNTTALVELAGEMGYERRRTRSAESPSLASYTIQSKLSQMQRQRAADRFRAAKTGVLFSSDVTARGMDFPDVTHVIQVDTPRDRESYIHRLGRTGRQGKEGQGWILIPHSSIPAARRMLKGLPLNQNNDLQSADVDLSSGTGLTPSHEHLKELYAVIPKGLLTNTYTSLFGNAPDKIATAEEANDWAIHGWGWEAPPAVSSRWLSLMGLTRAPGMNVSRGRPVDEERDDEDPFNAMRGQVRDGYQRNGGTGRSWGGSDRRFRSNDGPRGPRRRNDH